MELALKRIAENKRTQAKRLDLSDCGLVNELPEELFECEWLEELDLSGFSYRYEKRRYEDRNDFSDFSFSNKGFEKLTNLESLDLSSYHITDLGFLQGLTSLQSLNLSYNSITDISLLQGLINLRSIILRWNYITDIAKAFRKLGQ